MRSKQLRPLSKEIEKTINALFKTADLSKLGKIEFPEFCELVKSMNTKEHARVKVTRVEDFYGMV